MAAKTAEETVTRASLLWPWYFVSYFFLFGDEILKTNLYPLPLAASLLRMLA